MLAREEEQYLAEMEQKEETTLERQAKMRERARTLKERRESERLQFVQEKYDQQFRFVLSVALLQVDSSIFAIWLHFTRV